LGEPPEKNKPIVSTADAVSDFGAAVDYILMTRGLDKINVMGWSWGTSIVGAYTAAHKAKSIVLSSTRRSGCSKRALD